jgi:YfiH family protein
MIEPRPAHPFAWATHSWGAALHSSRLDDVAPHLFTTRDLALRGPHSEEGWRHLAVALDVHPSRLARLKQVHGTTVHVLRHPASIANAGKLTTVDTDDDGRPRADIVMTDDPSIAVAVQVADCVPLLLADPATGAVAAVHAGWRGTAAGAAREAVAAMQAHFGTRPSDLVAAIGPSIGPCCYQVGADVVDAFHAAGFAGEQICEWFRPEADDLDTPRQRSWRKTPVVRDAGHSVLRASAARYLLDVPKANIDQLSAAGLQPANIGACRLCTACHPSVFHSYRRDGAGTGRLAGAIRPR